jgi:hypothetical protein
MRGHLPGRFRRGGAIRSEARWSRLVESPLAIDSPGPPISARRKQRLIRRNTGAASAHLQTYTSGIKL